MKKPAVHTIESLCASTEEYGDCLHWTGYIVNGSPYVHHQKKMVSVRKLIAQLRGDEIVGPYFAASCGDPKCIHPDHIAQRSVGQHAKDMAKKASTGVGLTNRITKTLIWRRANPIKLDMDKARLIRADVRSFAEIATASGVSKSMVAKIKSGKYWRETSNPFGGLGSRA